MLGVRGIANALCSGVLFTWFESFPLVFGSIYHFDLGQQGLVFLGIFVGTLVALPLSLCWNHYRIVPRFTKPTFQPEELLPITFVGAICLPICLFWYGWSARASVHFMVPVVGSSLFGVALLTLFPPVLNYLGIAYPKYVASVFAGNGLFRATFGAVFPLFVSLSTGLMDQTVKTDQASGPSTVRKSRYRTRELAARGHLDLLHAIALHFLEGLLSARTLPRL